MMKKIVKQLLVMAISLTMAGGLSLVADAAQVENTTQTEETESNTQEETEEREKTSLTFEIAIFTYEMLEDATQEDMPNGFTLGDWEYHGVAVKAGFTENSDMVCVMGEDWETGYQYRFIYDPAHDMFVPYFGTDIKNGYIYTIPMYEDAEVPYGFVESYFVIQTVPMFTYMREDAELTQEEIAVGSLSEDNYLVFLMMDENGKEVHYTYDLVDRTYQRSLLQKKDAEKVTELNEVIDELHADIGELNAINAERMNQRLTIIGILVAAVVIMIGIIVNLVLKMSRFEKSETFFDDKEDEETEEPVEFEDYEEDEETEVIQETEEEEASNLEVMHLDAKIFFDGNVEDDAEEEADVDVNDDTDDDIDDDIEIVDLDEEDF